MLNQTDGTVTAINAQTNELDTHGEYDYGGNAAGVGGSGAGAERAGGGERGHGDDAGIAEDDQIPLCSSTALPTNPNCDPTIRWMRRALAQILATVPVGMNPIMVTVLSDGTRAYVANAGVAGCRARRRVAVPGLSTTCSVSVVNLTTNTVTATIPINGHPVYIASVELDAYGQGLRGVQRFAGDDGDPDGYGYGGYDDSFAGLRGQRAGDSALSGCRLRVFPGLW